jgi:hypothetical protein
MARALTNPRNYPAGPETLDLQADLAWHGVNNLESMAIPEEGHINFGL